MPNTAPNAATCTGHGSKRTVSLPVADPGGRLTRIRPSKSGPRRAIVLGTVQALMILHVALWLVGRHYGWWGGATLSPVEPSEAHQTLAEGIVNAGFVLFVLALLSTALFGRWFCGWGCHVVMLQDLCRWLLRRIGIQPKPFRSRLLPWMTLVIALYMFVWPVVHRLGLRLTDRLGWTASALEPWHLRWEFTTTELWQTFPGLVVAVLFLGTCGFVAVYFLGAKGYCTYGCPYGGFFAPLDRLAVTRIRVTDACEQCGHCTAVCSSNVRVHDEVREFGMVVDPGCMKCLDCVSVCPNDALYVGLGRPAVRRGEPRHAPPRANFDLTLREEIALVAVYCLTLVSMLSLYDMIPLLMASGIAAVFTYLVWKGWRLLASPNVNVHRFRLRRGGSITPAGWVFAGLVVLVMTFTAHSAVMRGLDAVGYYYARSASRADVSSQAASDRQRRRLDRAVRCYETVSSMSQGGLGLMRTPRVDHTLALLYLERNEPAAAEVRLRALHAQFGDDHSVCRLLGRALTEQDLTAEATAWYERILVAHPLWLDVAEDAAEWHRGQGRSEPALIIRRRAWEHNPGSAEATRELARLLLLLKRFDEGEPLLRRTLELDPDHGWTSYSLALLLGSRKAWPEAAEHLARALAAEPENARYHEALGYLLQETGRPEEAARAFERAKVLREGVGAGR